MFDTSNNNIPEQVKLTKRESIVLAGLSSKKRNEALLEMGKKLLEYKIEILDANKRDMSIAKKDLESGGLSQALYDRLKLDDDKFDQIMSYINDIVKQDDLVGKQISKILIDDDLVLKQISCPIGLICVVFESRPDVLPQVMSLAIKSGNGIIMKGGSEANNTNEIMFKILNEAVVSITNSNSSLLVKTREDISEILDLDDEIDLIIPRGSNKFVKYVMENTNIPVLGHADGVCSIYIDNECDKDIVDIIVLDSKVNYPAACNAVENILVNAKIANEVLPLMVEELKKANVEVLGCLRVRKIVDVKVAKEEDWKTEYSDLKVSIKIVDDLGKAINFINENGSGHTDVIISESEDKKNAFYLSVDSACVSSNCSTRFSDGYVFGKGAEVGISTNKIHARGPVGVEGLMIYKYILEGKGQIRADYMGKNARKYKHELL